MGGKAKAAQADLAQLQSTAQAVSEVVQNQFAVSLRNSQSSLQTLAQQAADAGIDASKLADLQAKAAVAADNLAVAQDRAAAALQKAANITIDAASSEDQITAAQNQAALAADKVAVAQNNAAMAMTKLQTEAGNLSTAVAASSEKTGLFSGMMMAAQEKSSSFFGGIKAGVGGLIEFGSKVGMTIMGVQMMAQMFVGATDAAGKMIGDFQQQLTKLVTTAGESQDHIKMVGDGMLAMAGPTGTAVKDLGDAMYWVESGGAHGAQGLTDLKIAAMGAKDENANLTDVTKTLMFVLNTYKDTGITAAGAMNTLIAATGQGEMTLQDLSGAVSNVLPASSKLGISLADTTAAIATMTMQGDNAASAATHLRQMIVSLAAPTGPGADAMKLLGLTAQQVGDQMRVSLPGAIQLIVDRLKKFPEGSAAYNEVVKGIAGGSKQLMGFLELSGVQLQAFKDNVTAVTGAVKSGGDSIAGWDLVQQNFNFRMDQAKAAVGSLAVRIGTELAPVATAMVGFFVDKILPALNSFSDWFISVGIPAIKQFPSAVSNFFAPIQNAIGWLNIFVGHGQAAIPIIAGIGAAITVALIPALVGLLPVLGGVAVVLGGVAVEVVTATWPFLAIGAAVGGLVAIFMHFYNTSAPFRNVITAIGNAMKSVGDYIVSAFQPVWQQLVETWQTQLLPAFAQLLPLFNQLKPLLLIIGEIIGGVLVVALGLLVGLLTGAAKGLAMFLQGIIMFVGGVATALGGFVHTISGLLALIYDLFTGNWKKLGTDLGTMWDGIVTMAKGFGQALLGAFVAGFGAVGGFIWGFVSGIIGFFQHLYDSLVGHSLVPDLVNGIVACFASLPGSIGSAISGMGAALTDGLTSIASNALTLGSNIATQIANGITSGIGAVGNVVNTLWQEIAAYFPQSPPKKGPGKALPLWGPSLVNQFAADLKSTSPAAHAAAEQMMRDVGKAIATYPAEIAKAHAEHNIGLEKQLKSEFSMLKAQESAYKTLIKGSGDKFSTKDPNNPIIFHSGVPTSTGVVASAGTALIDKFAAEVKSKKASDHAAAEHSLSQLLANISSLHVEIAKAHLTHNTTLEKQLKSRLSDLKAQESAEKSIIRSAGDTFSTKDPNNPIIFGVASHGGTVSHGGGSHTTSHHVAHTISHQVAHAIKTHVAKAQAAHVKKAKAPAGLSKLLAESGTDLSGEILPTSSVAALPTATSPDVSGIFAPSDQTTSILAGGPLLHPAVHHTLAIHKKAAITKATTHHDTQPAFGDTLLKETQGAFGGVGKWFGDRWHDVQNWWGGAGKWFEDVGSNIWKGITGFFGGVGKWFGDRWHDVQNIFGNVGKWFSDKWNEIYAPLKPVGDYIGQVFHTIWNIIVALWGKLGAKFHEWWDDAAKPLGAFVDAVKTKAGEAWKAITGFFDFLGKYFSDRWEDTKKILMPIVGVFYYLFKGAWDKIVEVFTPLGKTFQGWWKETQDYLAGVGGFFHDKFMEGWNKIVEIFSPLGKMFQDRWNDVMNGLNTFKTNAVAKFNELGGDINNIFHNIINGVIDKLNAGTHAVVDFLNYFGKGLNDLAKSLGTQGTVQTVQFQPIPYYAQGTESHPGGLAIVGEKGREAVWLPKGSKVAPNNVTEMLLSMSGGKLPGYAGGIGDIASNILNWVAGGAQSVLDGLISSMNITAPNLPGMENIATGMFNKVKDWALGWIDKLLPSFMSAGVAGQAVNVPGTVKDWIAQAIALTGTPSSWAADLGIIAMNESGGRPDSINLWDSNAQAGHPSQGIMQMIPSTFAAYALPGHENILNAIDNISSAIGYIRARYGDVFHVPGIESLAAGNSYIGYAGGTNYAQGGMAMVGEQGPELMYIPRGAQIVPNSRLTSGLQGGTTIVVNPPAIYLDGRLLANGLMPYIVDGIRYSTGVRS